MEIPNYDSENNTITNFKRLYEFMPNNIFRMLLCSLSGAGNTNLLVHMLQTPLLYFDIIYLYAKNLEQQKYQDLMRQFDEKSKKVGYKIIECSNDDIIPVNELDNQSLKIIIFDDYICEKKQKPLIDYFIQGRHKKCSVIYLSQSFYKTPKDIRLNCSHFCIYDFPSNNERSLICRELNVDKMQYIKATKKPFSFLYVDKPMKRLKQKFYGTI